MLVKRLAFGRPGFIDEEARWRKSRKSREVAATPLPMRPAPPSFHGSAGAFRAWPTPPRKD
jgi:hypothetical protein